MNVDTIQELIKKTDYWDMRILDVKASYFGDEVELLIDNNEETYWKYPFYHVIRYHIKRMLTDEKLVK